jgi:hypothetical protein
LIEGDGGEHHARQSPDHEDQDEAEDEQHGCSEYRLSAEDRREPRQDDDPGRDRDHEARDRDEAQRYLRQAHGEHVVDPYAETEERDTHLAQDDVGVANDRPPAERRKNRRGDPEGGEDDQVHERVSEDPEEVLPEQRIAAGRRIVEVESGPALELEQDGGQRESGQ